MIRKKLPSWLSNHPSATKSRFVGSSTVTERPHRKFSRGQLSNYRSNRYQYSGNMDAGPRRCFRCGSTEHIVRFCNQGPVTDDDVARANVSTAIVSESENVQVHAGVAASSLCTTSPSLTYLMIYIVFNRVKNQVMSMPHAVKIQKHTLIGSFHNVQYLRPW